MHKLCSTTFEVSAEINHFKSYLDSHPNTVVLMLSEIG